jgi:type III secretion protein U
MSDEKNEEPTHKKIEDARKKGQIAVSRDLARLSMLVVVAELAMATDSLWRGVIFNLMEAGIHGIGQDFMPVLMAMFSSAGIFAAIVVAVCFVVCVVIGVAAHWGQFGMLVASEALTPKFDKLNPINGLKQVISKKKLVELMTTVGKAVLIGWMVYVLVRGNLSNIVSLSSGDPKDAYDGFITILRTIFHVVIVLCLCMALVDFAIQKYFHKKELMMDKEEIKREHKESEGDPLIKGQRKRLARQWANEAPAAKTANSNAVVVNPTHFAVALYYDAAQEMVPQVLAKGKNEVARAMIRRARECGIPVIRHVWLARHLYAHCDEDTVIHRESYEAVAHVYAVVHELVASAQTGRQVELESHGIGPGSA